MKLVAGCYPKNKTVYKYRKSSIKPPPSQISPPFFGKTVNKPPLAIKLSLPTPNYSSLINDRLYSSIKTVELCVD